VDRFSSPDWPAPVRCPDSSRRQSFWVDQEQSGADEGPLDWDFLTDWHMHGSVSTHGVARCLLIWSLEPCSGTGRPTSHMTSQWMNSQVNLLTAGPSACRILDRSDDRQWWNTSINHDSYGYSTTTVEFLHAGPRSSQWFLLNQWIIAVCSRYNTGCKSYSRSVCV
jgi:hypothetical protein